MQDPSDSMEIAEPEESGRIDTTESPVGDDPTSDSDTGSTTSTVLVEVLPGVAVVAGEVPPELKPDLIDFGLVPQCHVAKVDHAGCWGFGVFGVAE